jgi:hypothetical protein
MTSSSPDDAHHRIGDKALENLKNIREIIIAGWIDDS